ncbi:hypothetical protein HZS_38 [Henneguya salminicola]|nr:hypothetical protein HZS_38 [Henneguya salminicola]
MYCEFLHKIITLMEYGSMPRIRTSDFTFSFATPIRNRQSIKNEKESIFLLLILLRIELLVLVSFYDIRRVLQFLKQKIHQEENLT